MTPQGKSFLRAWEGLRLVPYKDSGDAWTNGIGHLLLPGEPIVPWSEEYALRVFDEDIASHEKPILDALQVDLNPHETDALVSIAYNLGPDAVLRSTLFRLVNEGEFAFAACEFPRWVNVGGKPNLGLYRRRCAEQAVFLLADYSRLP